MVTAASIWVILKKTFSLALILNALFTLVCVGGIIYAFYIAYPNWSPYSPYLLNGNLFWLAIAAALINMFPSAAIGRALHTGRFLFHHYVYGAFVLAGSSAYIFFFTRIPIQNLYLIESNSIPINAVRVCLLAGLALFLDDLPDCAKWVEASLNWIKAKAFQVRKGLHALQIGTGLIAIYCAVAMAFTTIDDPSRILPDSICMASLIITGITSFALAKKGAWLKISSPLHKTAQASTNALSK